MSNVYVNSTSAVQGATRWESDPRTGARTVATFAGERSFIEAKELEFRENGWATSVEQGPVWRLTASVAQDVRDAGSVSGTDTPVDTYELFANVIEKDILASDNALVAGLPNDDRAFLRSAIDGKIDLRDYDYSIAAKTPAFSSSDTNYIFKSILRGQHSVIKYQPILRHTKTIWSGYAIASALDGVGLIWSTTQLGLIGIPVSIINNLPASATRTDADGMIFYRGWLKAYPTIQASAYSKSQASVEWQFGDWAYGSYELYT